MTANRVPRSIENAIPLLDLKAQYENIREEVRAAVDRVLDTQRFILGPEVRALEQEIADYCGAQHAVGVSSGSDALLLCLMILGIAPGDEVITSTYTFFATAGAIARLGATPVFVDIDPATFAMDPALLERAISQRTKAIIPVHLFGQMADMDPIMALADRHSLTIIEDSAQSLGASYKGRSSGTIGHMGCYSFFPSKNLGGAGDGGMVVTNNANLDEKLRLYRNHGYQPKYYNKVVGGNLRLDEIQAAILRVKLRYLDRWTRARQRNADRYRQLFVEAGLGGQIRTPDANVTLPVEMPERRHVYNQFVISTSRRDALQEHLTACGIGSEVYYPRPMHLQECFDYLGHKEGDFLVSERASRESLAIPIYPELTEDMQRVIVNSIRGFVLSG